jgi:WD40 repeat protein
MGVVYKALDLRLSRLVALKMIVSGPYSGPEELNRIRKEAEALARLRHPNVVQIYDIGEHDGRPFLALELCEAGSLAGQLRRMPLQPRPSAQLLESLSRAVHAAHECGIVHRDLKPANVLLTKDGVPKLTDFGLAKRFGDKHGSSAAASHTPSGMVLGTPGYMAPEQAEGKSREVGPAIDVYGLGAILYELLTARPPFLGETVADAIMQVLTRDPVPPSSIHPNVPRDLETICLKCLQKEPRKRYQSALELADELGRFFRGEPIKARPLSRPARFWRWCLRKPALATASGLALLAGLAILVVSLVFAIREYHGAKRIGQEQERTAAALNNSQRLAATLALDRGIALCEQGEVGRGMLWLVHSLELTPENAADLRRVIRINLGAWRSQLRVHRHSFHGPDSARKVGFSPDGTLILTGFMDGTVRLWNSATGAPVGATMKEERGLEAFTFSPNGKLLATVCGNTAARLWDTATGHPVGEPLLHPTRVFSLTFSPDGRTLLTGCDDGACRFWDVASQSRVGDPLLHVGRLNAIAYSPNGKIILSASGDGTARLWDSSSRRPVGAVMKHQGGVETALFSKDGKIVVTGGPQYTVGIWDTATGEPLGQPLQHLDSDQARITGQSARVSLALAISPDAKMVVTGGDGGTARLWDVATGQLLVDLRHPDWISDVSFSPDGRSFLTACGDGNARLWDAATGLALGPPIPHGGGVDRAAFSPDGSMILLGGYERTARLWETSLPCVAGPFLTHDGAILAAAFSPDGRLIVTAGKGKVARLWDANSGREIGEPLPQPGLVRNVAFSPDSKILATGSSDGAVLVWDVATRKLLATQPPRHGGFIWSVAFSPDGQTVASASLDKTAMLWDVSTSRLRCKPLQHDGPVDFVAFSPDGALVATASYDRTARLWNAQTGELLAVMLHDKEVWVVVFSPDSKLLASAGPDSTARLWDLRSRQAHGRPIEHQNRVFSLAFSPDSKLLLTGCEDRTARIWDVATGRPASPPLMHQGAVLFSVAFGKDCKTVLTGCHDGTARLWDVATGKSLGPPMRHRKDVQRVAYSPDGTTVLTASMDGTARVWQVPAEVTSDERSLKLWVQVTSGIELVPDSSFHWLEAPVLQQRRQELTELSAVP